MGTKNRPDPDDCFERALPDEPYFTLLARDPIAPIVLRQWAHELDIQISAGNKPVEDLVKVGKARELAERFADWRSTHEGEWRQSTTDPRLEESQPASASLHLDARVALLGQPLKE